MTQLLVFNDIVHRSTLTDSSTYCAGALILLIPAALRIGMTCVLAEMLRLLLSVEGVCDSFAISGDGGTATLQTVLLHIDKQTLYEGSQCLPNQSKLHVSLCADR